MDITYMRQAIIERYGPTIRNQNVAYMPEHQVVAIYKSMIDRGDTVTKTRKIPKKYFINKPVKYEQMKMEI